MAVQKLQKPLAKKEARHVRELRISTVEATTEGDPHISIESTSPVSVPGGPAVTDLSAAAAPSSESFNQHQPFADLAGRCFLRVCLWADTLASLARATRSSLRTDASEAVERQGWPRPVRLRFVGGAVSCTVAAALLVPVSAISAYRPFVPFILLMVICCIAVRFGNIAGVAGTLCAALLLTTIRIEPGLAIGNPVDRNHLISMVIMGVCASELVGRRNRAIGLLITRGCVSRCRPPSDSGVEFGAERGFAQPCPRLRPSQPLRSVSSQPKKLTTH